MEKASVTGGARLQQINPVVQLQSGHHRGTGVECSVPISHWRKFVLSPLMTVSLIIPCSRSEIKA